jgi:hypothetical protein
MNSAPVGQAQFWRGDEEERPEYVHGAAHARRAGGGKIAVETGLAGGAAGAGAGYDRTDTLRIIGVKLCRW